MLSNQAFYRLIIASLFSFIVCSNPVGADEDDLRLAAGLRERRLFQQAEYVCRQALSGGMKGSNASATGEQPSPQMETALVVELIKIHSDRARFATLDQRSVHWQSAKKEAERFLNLHPEHSRKLIVRLQAALIESAQVQLFQQEQNFGVVSDLDSTVALDLSRSLRQQLIAIEEQINVQLRDARNKSLGNESMDADELTNLQRNVQFQIAQAGFQRANLYGTDAGDQSLNRASALSEVLAQLTTLQRVNEPGSTLWWQTQLALSRCYRELQDFKNAQAVLDRTGEADLKRQRKKWHGLILAEQAELLLANCLGPTEIDVAQRVLLAIDRQSVVSARSDWMALKLVAALHAASTSEPQQAELLQQAERRAGFVFQQHGPWWGTRARQFVAKEFGKSGQGGEVEIQFTELVRQGQAAQQAGEFARATAAFEQAASIAKQIDDASAWRSCQINASQSLEQLGRHGLAADKFLETANDDPKHPSAASLHLRGIWNLAQVKTKSQNGEGKFSNAMKEHLSRWPNSKTLDQVRLWLGKQQLADGQPELGAATLLAISQDSKYRAEAVRDGAKALENSNHLNSAGILDALAEERPRNVAVLMAQARLQARLVFADSDRDLQVPLKLWRELGRRLKPETNPWFEAKFNVARLLVASGEPAKAAQLLDYLSALPGGWSKSDFRSQLTDLRQKIRTGRVPE